MVFLSRKDIMSRLRESSRDNCINWRGSPLRSGDNVMFLSRNPSLHGSLPGQIIDIQDYRDIPNRELSDVDVLSKNGRTRMILIRHRSLFKGKGATNLDPVQYSQIPDGMKEVVDTLELEWVQWNFVLSPCFIFHADTIQRGLFTSKGMERIFFIRFSRTRNGKMIPISESNWNPFYRDEVFPKVESYPEALWNNIVSLKHEVQKALSRGGQWDGRTVSIKFYSQPSFFSYLKDELEFACGEDVLMHSYRFTRSRKVMFDTLATTRRKVKHDADIIRVLTEDQLEVVRKVLGTSFGVGVLQPLPSLKTLKANPSVSGTVWLRNSDPVRVISCSPEVGCMGDGSAKPVFYNILPGKKGRQPFRLLCSYRGIDFRYNAVKYGFSELSIQMRFVKVRGDSNVVKKVVGKVTGDDDSGDSDSSSIMVAEGDFITLESNRVYLVSEVGHDGTVRCVSPANQTNEPIVISIEEANQAFSRMCK
jgi:hypothetical protein